MERYPIEELTMLLCSASAAILRYHRQTLQVTTKADHSPLTQADIAAHKILVEGLTRLMPDTPIISEEDEVLKPVTSRYFLVDPLDGTRSFVRGEDDFSINIGLVENGEAVFGMIAMPVTGSIYVGGRDIKAYKLAGDVSTPLHTHPVPKEGLRVVKSVAANSEERMQRFLSNLSNVDQVQGISSAVKFCMIAEGGADLYPRFGRTMEWDTAAGQAIVEAAGGSVTTPEGKVLRYGKPKFENGPFIVRGR